MAEKLSEKDIENINIEGNVRISDENIKFISGLEEGVSINNFNIQNAIKKLWDTNLYLDIRIDVDKKYNIVDDSQFPEISRFDPVALAIGIRPNQVCEIERPSPTSIRTYYYRLCN